MIWFLSPLSTSLSISLPTYLSIYRQLSSSLSLSLPISLSPSLHWLIILISERNTRHSNSSVVVKLKSTEMPMLHFPWETQHQPNSSYFFLKLLHEIFINYTAKKVINQSIYQLHCAGPGYVVTAKLGKSYYRSQMLSNDILNFWISERSWSLKNALQVYLFIFAFSIQGCKCF